MPCANPQRARGIQTDNARVAVTAGYGVRFAAPLPPIALDAFTQAQFLLPRDNVKEASVSASNPGSPKVATSGAIGAAGVTAEVRF